MSVFKPQKDCIINILDMDSSTVPIAHTSSKIFINYM